MNHIVAIAPGLQALFAALLLLLLLFAALLLLLLLCAALRHGCCPRHCDEVTPSR
jgi:hypothetical protein